MHPWHVKLVKGKESDGALFSRRELRAKQMEHHLKQGGGAQKNRSEIFGYESSAAKPKAKARRNDEIANVLQSHAAPMPYNGFGDLSNTVAVPQPFRNSAAGGGGSLFGTRAAAAGQPSTGGLFGNAPQYQSQSMVMPEGAPTARHRRVHDREYMDLEEEKGEDDEDMGFGLFDDEGPKPLMFEEGAWDESGMTTVSFSVFFCLSSLLRRSVILIMETTFILACHLFPTKFTNSSDLDIRRTWHEDIITLQLDNQAQNCKGGVQECGILLHGHWKVETGRFSKGPNAQFFQDLFVERTPWFDTRWLFPRSSLIPSRLFRRVFLSSTRS